MSAPEAVFLSYRLGGADGVGVEAAKWDWALRELGFTTRRVAGEFEGTARPDDTWLAFLAIDPVPGAPTEPDALAASLAGADLVVVENLCSLPLNLAAATVARDVLGAHRGRVCFHHHDFAWERPNLAHIDGFPPTRPDSLHVTISAHAQGQLRDRDISAHVVPNTFDFSAGVGERAATRAAHGFDEADVVLLQPTRAIPRKNVEGGLHFARAVADRLHGRSVRYWLTGPAEDGYEVELDRLLGASDVPVHTGRAPRRIDAYAACDLVVFPSTWEGFGNPVVESVAARRLVAVDAYPVLDEIATGLVLLSIHDPDGAATWLDSSPAEQDARLDANYAVAQERFAIEHLPDRIRDAFAAVGWTNW